MQIRSFRGSGEPVWVNAHLLSARDCLGPDPRRALGPAATPAASTGRTRDRTRPMLQKCQKVLAIEIDDQLEFGWLLDRQVAKVSLPSGSAEGRFGSIASVCPWTSDVRSTPLSS